jgi:hypothetical protein
LHEKFGWIKNVAKAGEYFKPAEDVQFESLIKEAQSEVKILRDKD